MQGELLFIGTGGSMGIPVIGCSCAVCLSDNKRNKRLRASALVTLARKKLLIDCGPDFRQQALHYKIDHIDGLLLTHCHHDHTASIDELRAYTMASGEPVQALASAETKADLEMRFPYIFNPGEGERLSLTPKIEIEPLKGRAGTTLFQGVKIGYCSYSQGGMQVNGFRFGNLAYLTDVKDYEEAIFDELQGVEILVLNALRFTPSPIHLTIDEAVAFARRVGAKKTWLTHIAHELDHEKANAYLPPDVRAVYDGLSIDFQGSDD